MGICKNCNGEITWPQPYVKGNPPNNPDGTPHRCKKSDQPVKGDIYPGKQIEVTWPTIDIDDKRPDMVELQEGSKGFTALAYENVLERVKDIDTNGSLFGTMVNAEKTHLINLALIKAIKSKESA
jgi:hypothetical protein